MSRKNNQEGNVFNTLRERNQSYIVAWQAFVMTKGKAGTQ